MTVVLPALGPGVSDFSACRALLLDPFVANRRLLRDMLQMLDVGEIAACANAHEAWRELETAAWSLMFVDWSTKSDAVAFLRTLRAEGTPHRFLPVVVMSGFGSDDAVRRVRDVGASEYMLKPLSLEAVRSRLRSALLRPRMFVATEDFFGPDRRRRRLPPGDQERRSHENWRESDRRSQALPSAGRERRHSCRGFLPLERRAEPRA